ncbi:Flp family type IVb pilin [Rhizobium sp. TRM95111]|uniref:Flp family type IVb pilin n=1 Tax=Rhizobium alarense TaxID=2846851 RepID=UPI001F255C9F|nr:Flp family type IVb pilin [Rhizobium alarense]MCF3642203.1 Flp family type IVb pilin [Rhizobium alarense]
MRIWKFVWRSRDGATAVEYGVLAMAICVAIITGLSATSSSLNNVFITLDNAIGELPARE